MSHAFTFYLRRLDLFFHQRDFLEITRLSKPAGKCYPESFL